MKDEGEGFLGGDGEDGEDKATDDAGRRMQDEEKETRSGQEKSQRKAGAVDILPAPNEQPDARPEA
jgi:hypothetical protein